MDTDLKKCAVFMKALSDETRLGIFFMLLGKKLCACEINEQLHITQPTLSYHMKILCISGLIKEEKDGIWKRYYVNEKAVKCFGSIIEKVCENLEK